MHKILVLMTTYNGSDFLQQQLDSIIEQEQVHLSIEIQDDCSDHSTKNILKEYQKRPNINITHNKLNSGGAAKNFYKLFKKYLLMVLIILLSVIKMIFGRKIN